MAQSARYSKNPINFNLFWEKASAESSLEWSKWAAIHEMAAFTKDGIEGCNLIRAKLALFESAEPMYEDKLTSETEAQKKLAT